MSILGWILLVAGAAVSVLILLGQAPAQLAELPVPLWGWLVVAAVGAALVFLNRRPGD
ncbi:MAG: hypothetical protein IT368_05440 [Candidatus Hydrogenedentes bacterium]|nr:hypothetical protein [Candidatus Hydrogenedentota bacterium]